MGEGRDTRYVVAADDDGIRLDLWLARVAAVSRSRAQALIREGRVQCDTVDMPLVPKTAISAGAEFRLHLPPPVPAEPQPQALRLDVLHEDADMIVVHKPAGMVVHPAAGHADGTLVNALLHHCEDLEGIGGTLRPGIVHRLDKDTSGVLVVAKRESVLLNLAKQFQARTVKKKYLAIAVGIPVPATGKIETQIGRSRHDRKKMSANPGATGKHAVSRYRVLESTDSFSWVAVQIETGRTHQIRVHLAHIGCPVAGDCIYGASRKARWADLNKNLRHMLHAAELTLTHPATGMEMCFAAPLPDDMRQFATQCGLSACPHIAQAIDCERE